MELLGWLGKRSGDRGGEITDGGKWPNSGGVVVCVLMHELPPLLGLLTHRTSMRLMALSLGTALPVLAHLSSRGWNRGGKLPNQHKYEARQLPPYTRTDRRQTRALRSPERHPRRPTRSMIDLTPSSSQSIDSRRRHRIITTYRTRFTWPRPFLLRPWFRRLTVMVSACFCVKGGGGM